MRRTTPLTAAVLLGLALLAPTTSATAAGETCHGEPATIVGTGPSLTGTEGRDVIVTGPAGVVDALGGDDFICVTGPVRSSDVLSVVAGAGNDLVDTSALEPGYYVTTVLGTGADRFIGGRAGDAVYAGEQTRTSDGGYASAPDTEKDTIDTGEGNDSVFTGSPGAPNRDVVTLGLGADYLFLGASAVTSEAVLDGGAGEDVLSLTGGDGDIALDMAQGTITSDQGTARFAAFEASRLSVGSGRVTYRGTAGDDDLEVHPRSAMPTLDIATAAGQDRIVVEPATIAAGSRIDGGDGRNILVAANRSGTMALDLTAGSLVIDGRSMGVAGLQDALLMAPEISMTGNARGNNLFFAGCDATLVGGAGRDQLLNVYDSTFESYVFDCSARTRMSGGGGADRLRGGQGKDVLLGGSGNDTVEGRGGNDRINAGRGRDAVDGGEGRDVVRGGAGRDTLEGRGAADVLIGGSGIDSADGSTGRDRCVAEREQRCER